MPPPLTPSEWASWYDPKTTLGPVGAPNGTPLSFHLDGYIGPKFKATVNPFAGANGAKEDVVVLFTDTTMTDYRLIWIDDVMGEHDLDGGMSRLWITRAAVVRHVVVETAETRQAHLLTGRVAVLIDSGVFGGATPAPGDAGMHDLRSPGPDCPISGGRSKCPAYC